MISTANARRDVESTQQPPTMFPTLRRAVPKSFTPFKLPRPSWSVNDLLSTYPVPELSSAALVRLHKSSALVPPSESSKEFTQLKSEMQELIRLVEAVKLVDTTAVKDAERGAVSDGKIWAQNRGININPPQDTRANTEKRSSGRELLKHASKSVDGYFVVETPSHSSQ